MRKGKLIADIACKLCSIYTNVDEFAKAAESAESRGEEVSGIYEEIMIDAIKHGQILTLELAKIITEDEEEADEVTDLVKEALAAAVEEPDEDFVEVVLDEADPLPIEESGEDIPAAEEA